jgi:branched-chain amino acid transport system substrate-binding protein
MYEPYNRLKFGLYASYYDQMRAGVKQVMEKEHIKAPCALWQDTDFGRDVMAGVYAQLKAMNVKLVAEASHKPTDTDFTASVARMRDAKCDFLFVASIVRDTNLIISVARKGGWNVPMMGPASTYDVNVAEVPGNANEGLYGVTPILFVGANDPRPAVQEFVKNFKANFGHDPNFAAQVGWTAANLLIDGLQRAGRDLTVDSFVAGMESISGYEDIFGSPKMSFGPRKRQGSNESFLVQVRNGKWVPALEGAVSY